MSWLTQFDVEEEGRQLYLCPRGITSGVSAGISKREAPTLAGGKLCFRLVELIGRVWNSVDSGCPSASYIQREIISVDALHNFSKTLPSATATAIWSWMDALTADRAPLFNLTWTRPYIMGIINVTPDSFSDGGNLLVSEQVDLEIVSAVARLLVDQGADILDVGGESTRPGAIPLTSQQEQERVLPALSALAMGSAKTRPLLSIDTYHAETMRAACGAGADILNDVTALTGDSESLAVAAAAHGGEAPIILMHMQGRPRTMQNAPYYDYAPLDIYDALAARVEACEAVGISRRRLILDPGIGFGKSVTDNLEILNHLALLHGLGCPLLLGCSRKNFIAKIGQTVPIQTRLAGSLAAALSGLDQGIQILRVHDVGETCQAINVWAGIRGLI